MSSPVNVGDIVLLSKLAWQVYQSFKSAPKELEALSFQVLSISNLLRQIEDSFEELYLNKHQRLCLRDLVSQCTEVLQDVEKIVKRYASIGSETGKWKILRWQLDSESIHQVKQQLMEQVTLLTNFNSTITIWSLAGIKKKLNRLVLETLEGSIVSAQDASTLNEEENANWPQLARELEDRGVAPEVIAKNRQYFVKWIAAAISENEAPPDEALDKLWSSPIEGETQPCVFCDQEDHTSAACEQIDIFETNNRSSPIPVTIPEDDELPVTPPPSFEGYPKRVPAGSTHSRRKLSWTNIGTDTSISAGFGPGSGPQVPLHRARPSSVSTDSSSSRASRILSNDSSPTTDSGSGKRPSLKKRLHSKVSSLGSSSLSTQHGFS